MYTDRYRKIEDREITYLKCLPKLADATKEFFQSQLSLSSEDNLFEYLLVFLNIAVPDITQSQFVIDPSGIQSLLQFLPMAFSKGLRSQIVDDSIVLEVRF